MQVSVALKIRHFLKLLKAITYDRKSTEVYSKTQTLPEIFHILLEYPGLALQE